MKFVKGYDSYIWKGVEGEYEKEKPKPEKKKSKIQAGFKLILAR